MSISNSLSNAHSGLVASARAAQVVSSNVANSLTEGYGRRELELTSASLAGAGAGVGIVGITRNVDHQTIASRRLVDAELGDLSARTGFLSALMTTAGPPETEGSLTSRMAHLEASIIEATSRPESEPRLLNVFNAATGVAQHIQQTSDQIQKLRQDADQEIGRQVAKLNSGLENVAKLNVDIRIQLASGNDASALLDQRQQQIESIATIVPLVEADRGNGQVALYTPGGAVLLDGKAANIGFAPVGVIVAQMTVESGALSGLTINGQPAPAKSMQGGSLAGQFAVRDQLAPYQQGQLDAIARDLIERFSDISTDPTLAPGDPGLFSDAGAAFDPMLEVGLAGRISVNDLVNPAAGGDLAKLRDGLGSIALGPTGDASRLLALADAIAQPRIAVSGDFSAVSHSAVGLSGEFLSLLNTHLAQGEADQSFSAAQSDTLRQIELQSGVDTDHEMQKLLLIEQAYSANARVISTIDELIQVLLGI